MQVTISKGQDFTPVTVAILCQSRKELDAVHVLGNFQSLIASDLKSHITTTEHAQLVQLLTDLYKCTSNYKE